jgi:hypothetical protein
VEATIQKAVNKRRVHRLMVVLLVVIPPNVHVLEQQQGMMHQQGR